MAMARPPCYQDLGAIKHQRQNQHLGAGGHKEAIREAIKEATKEAIKEGQMIQMAENQSQTGQSPSGSRTKSIPKTVSWRPHSLWSPAGLKYRVLVSDSGRAYSMDSIQAQRCAFAAVTV